jgi:histone-lysine N-methyltransferase SETMAR
MVGIDNTRVHTAQVTRNFFTHTGLRNLAHFPYSPDIAPSNFYLFRKVKNQLIGRSIQDEKEFSHEVMENMDSISTSELQEVFRNWMKKVESVIETDGEHLSQRTIRLRFGR